MDLKESAILHSLLLKGQATNFLKFGDELHKHYVCLHVGIVQYCVCIRCLLVYFDCWSVASKDLPPPPPSLHEKWPQK